MARIVGVRFKKNGKVYYFGPGSFELKVGDHVIVETVRGVEYGAIAIAEREASDDEIVSTTKSDNSNHNEMIYLFNSFLDEETKQIMILKFIYNYSFKEIAKMTNKTIGQIQGLYYDGIDKLRRGIENE